MNRQISKQLAQRKIVSPRSSWFAAFLLILSPQPASATLTSLPDINLDCYQSTLVGFTFPSSPPVLMSLDGDNLHKPRFKLFSPNHRVLKIIENPLDDERRVEYRKELVDITEAFPNDANIIGWRDDQSDRIKVYALNVVDRIFTVATLPTTGMQPVIGTVQTLKCSLGAS